MKVLYYICLFLLGLGACRPTITCEDVPCRYGQYCAANGECTFITEKCVKDEDCDNDQICDIETSRCVHKQLPCTDRFSCPDSQNCNALSGFCEPEALCSRDGCPVGETCNKSLETCSPSPCSPSRSDCPPRFLCNQENYCTTGCVDNSNCPVQETCLFLGESPDGSCVPSCRIDTDCPFGTVCRITKETSNCEKELSCDKDTDCRVDEICRFSQCRQPLCTHNNECQTFQFCEVSTGSCLDSKCEEDVYGKHNPPNFNQQNASILERGDYRNLRICPGTSDWFKLRFRSTDIVRVTIRTTTGRPISIVVIDDNENLIARDSRVENARSFRFSPNHSGDVFFQIKTNSNEVSIYDLQIETNFCANDTFEENDSQSKAKSIPSKISEPITLALKSCPLDLDWFALRNLSAEQGLELAFTQLHFPLDVTLITPNNEVLPISTGPKTTRLLKLGVEGDYFIRIESKQQSIGGFNLRVESTLPWECPNSGLHTSIEKAQVYNPLENAQYLCPTLNGFEVDWVKLSNLNGLVKVTIESDPDFDLDALLWRDLNAPKIVRKSVKTNFDKSKNTYVFVFTAVASKTYFLRVSSNTESKHLFFEPRYKITISNP